MYLCSFFFFVTKSVAIMAFLFIPRCCRIQREVVRVLCFQNTSSRTFLTTYNFHNVFIYQ
nr:MAG TPA: hypothetical protein [Ackermannviridae sp.]